MLTRGRLTEDRNVEISGPVLANSTHTTFSRSLNRRSQAILSKGTSAPPTQNSQEIDHGCCGFRAQCCCPEVGRPLVLKRERETYSSPCMSPRLLVGGAFQLRLKNSLKHALRIRIARLDTVEAGMARSVVGFLRDRNQNLAA